MDANYSAPAERIDSFTDWSGQITRLNQATEQKQSYDLKIVLQPENVSSSKGQSLTLTEEYIFPLPVLSSFYHLEKEQNVYSFLGKFPNLRSSLLEASALVREYFPKGRLVLRFAEDPEVSEFDALHISIHTKLPIEQAVNKLHEIDNRWIEDGYFHKSDGKIIIDLG